VEIRRSREEQMIQQETYRLYSPTSKHQLLEDKLDHAGVREIRRVVRSQQLFRHHVKFIINESESMFARK
jgi:hypothetical protein